jgi:hypothetical protein
MLHRLSVNSCNTILGSNFASLRYEFKVNVHSQLSLNIAQMHSVYDAKLSCHADVIKFVVELFDLLSCHSDFVLHSFDRSEILFMLHTVCTS